MLLKNTIGQFTNINTKKFENFLTFQSHRVKKKILFEIFLWRRNDVCFYKLVKTTPYFHNTICSTKIKSKFACHRLNIEYKYFSW